MHYVTAESIAKSFGIKPLFSNLTFHINEGDKIALVARNGAGKSTLLKILAGKDVPDSGKIWLHKDVEIAMFEQDPVFDEKKSVVENIFIHDHPVLNAIRDYELVIEHHDDLKLQQAIERMDELGAWDFDAKVKQVLTRLNIHHLDQPVDTLSGGQRRRVALAKTLIDAGFEHRHILLIMDEPTNHLDVEMVEWLEHYFNKENITLVLVTHDRYFLDSVCNEIWELENDVLYTYPGNYTEYLEKKAARIESEEASVVKARNIFRKELEWIRKQPRARTVKSKSRVDAFADVKKKAQQRIEAADLQLQMKMNRLGGKIAELKKVYKSYGEKTILSGFDYTFKKGERVGIVGKNGTGKTTFTNIIQGIDMPDSGKVNIGDTVIFGNYSQLGLEVKEDMRVIEYVKNIAESFMLADGGSLAAAQFLNLFLFPPDQQYTYISNLSGGEKRRLHLLTVLFRNPNFLVLDEPTNDLDLPTLNVLENFLSNFPGCLLIVSHDRYFMDKLVDHLLVFEGNGVIRDFPGNYSSYRLSLDEEKVIESKTIIPEIKTESKRKLSYKEKREFETLEKELKSLEQEKSALTEKLSSISQYEELQKMTARLTTIHQEIEEKEMKWLNLSEGGD